MESSIINSYWKYTEEEKLEWKQQWFDIYKFFELHILKFFNYII